MYLKKWNWRQIVFDQAVQKISSLSALRNCPLGPADALFLSRRTRRGVSSEHLIYLHKREKAFFVYSKKWVHSKIGQCVRPAVRLHDNSRKTHPIVMKILPQLYLINISVEFEDEPNLPRIYWVSARSILIFYIISTDENFDFMHSR